MDVHLSDIRLSNSGYQIVELVEGVRHNRAPYYITQSIMEKVYGVQPDVTTLDEDLKLLRDSKFSKESIEEIKNWIFNVVLKVKEQPSSESSLLDLLKDGTILCQLANTLKSEDDPNETNFIKWKHSNLPFVQMEQISQFLSFARGYGVPEDELFQTIDLYESKDPSAVYQTLKSLSRYANKKHPNRFSVLGPQLSEKRVSPPIKRKPDHLRGNNNIIGWSTYEYGYMGGASQGSEHIVFGQRRNIL